MTERIITDHNGRKYITTEPKPQQTAATCPRKSPVSGYICVSCGNGTCRVEFQTQAAATDIHSCSHYHGHTTGAETMTRDDVIAMATEKGLAYKSKYLATNDNYQFNEERLLDFANAIAAKAAADEREALLLLFPQPYMEYFGEHIQDAIRARSIKGGGV